MKDVLTICVATYGNITLGMRGLHTRPVRRSSISMPPVAGAYNPYRPSFEQVPSQKGMLLMIRFWERSIRLPFSTSMRATTLG